MKIAVLICRILLGLIFFVFGLAFFIHFFPPQPPMQGKAGAFVGGLFGSGYFVNYMKVVEVIGGLLLLVNRYTALALLVLFPITLNIFLFHVILAPEGAILGIAMILLNIFLGYAYRKYYASVFTTKPTL